MRRRVRLTNSVASRIKYLVRQASLWIALLIWCLLSGVAILLCRNGVPLDRPELADTPPIADVLKNSIGLISIVLLVGIVSLLARHRALPNLVERAPERGVALRETLAMWICGSVVLFAGASPDTTISAKGLRCISTVASSAQRTSSYRPRSTPGPHTTAFPLGVDFPLQDREGVGNHSPVEAYCRRITALIR